ncbi:serine hydrolase domain-containing protein [Spirillospora sp. NPDC127506]
MRWTAALAAATILGLVCAPAGHAEDGPDTAAIDQFVRERLASTRLPGLALAVTRGTTTVMLRGYGHDGRGDPLTPDAQLHIASLSKSFTAFAVMRLAEAGRIDLDRPVRRSLPGFRLADPAGDRITVRELLNQTSGLGDRGFPQIAHDEVTSLAGRVADLRHAHLVDAPGRAFHYSDLNYQVLGRLLEVVTGRPLSAVLRDEVFAPLGMNATLAVPTSQDGPRAAPRLAQGGILLYGFPVGRPELHGLLAGSSGVITTARDMTAWLVQHATGTAPDGRRLLSAAAIRTLHTPPSGVDGGYAMGWLARTPHRIEHHGVLATYSADQVVLPGSRTGIALLYPAQNALADTEGIKEGIIALATGRHPPGTRFPDGRVTAVLLGALTIGSAALRVRALTRIRRWTATARARSRWRTLALTVPQIAWPPAVAALAAALPWLIGRTAGRVFSHTQLFLAMPAIEIWLISAGILGIILSTARIAALARRPQRDDRGD